MTPQSTHEPCNRFVRRGLFVIALLGLSVTLGSVGVSLLAPLAAQAQSASSDLEQKAHWQERYRNLLQLQLRLRDNAEKSRENYARAQRRNYPRGGARQVFILDAEEAEAELVKVKAETEDLLEQARRSAMPRNWFYEVDDEALQPTPAAAANAQAEAVDDGRNPLYAK